MQKNKRSPYMTTKVIVYAAVFAAVAAVLGQLLAIRPVPSAKYTLDKFVIFLSGMFFGPLVGGMVGLVAEFTGGHLFGMGFTPWLCLPAVLYGVSGGLFQNMLAKKFTIPRLVLAYFLPTAIAAVLIQSAALAWTYNASTFWEAFYTNLIARSVQFSIMLVLEVAIIYILVNSNLFVRAGLWPPAKKTVKEINKMTVAEALDFINSVSWQGMRPGLERPAELLERMGSPEKELKFVHIGGTNGKGSTAAMTASILRKAGYKVGLYTSPHLYRFNERIQVNGREITDEELAEATAFTKPFAEAMEHIPTEFELVWCIAVEYFKRQNCDIVVVEVGMGGELDATNTIGVPEVAVITNVGLDHTGILGNTVEEIAQTKAGIFKEGGSAVIYRSGEAVEAVLEQVAREKHVQLKKADFDSIVRVSHSLEGQTFHCGSRKNIELPLLGDHQLYNASVALSVIDTLIEKGWKITEEDIYSGMQAVKWPGRFDIVSRDPLFIIDGGHNPQCFDALMKNVADYLPGKRIIALTGVLADKDYGEMFKPVMQYVEQFVCITPPSDRKLEAAELAAHLTAAGGKATAAPSIPAGVQMAKELAGADGVVLCFGSLYSIGEVHAAI